MIDQQDMFRRIVRTFMHVNHLSLADLKESIARNPDKEWPEEFKVGLRQAIDEETISVSEFERLTDNDFETQAEVTEWFKMVWDYLYGDGPAPR